jgi:hypothetical protein
MHWTYVRDVDIDVFSLSELSRKSMSRVYSVLWQLTVRCPRQMMDLRYKEHKIFVDWSLF